MVPGMKPPRTLLPILVCALALAWATAAMPVAARTDMDAAPASPAAERNWAVDATGPRARGETAAERCTADRRHCITLGNYVADVCRTLDAVAAENALDPHFFARLIWKESLFDAGAVSPVGAQGIAQFMPGTAALRGLKDAWNPAEALAVSARYLAELAAHHGNIGLAAVAYNGGEARAERFVAASGSLPFETRAYVEAITGISPEVWRDAPPRTLDLSLDGETAFQTACITMAENRGIREFRPAAPDMPWGVILASNRDRTGAERQVARITHRYSEVLAGEPVYYTRNRQPGLRGRFHFAQVGRQTRADAEALCNRLRAAGGDCMVLRN